MNERPLYEEIRDLLVKCDDRVLANVLELVIEIRKERREAFRNAHDLAILTRAIAKSGDLNGEA